MMITPPSPELRGMLCRKYCKEQLADMPSNELEELAKSLFEKNKGQKVNVWYLAFAGAEDDLFMACGACDVLEERHGEEYVDRLTGVRRPKTAWEHIKYFFTGEVPKYVQ